MGKPTGFLEIDRHDRSYAPVSERLDHYQEFSIALKQDELQKQGARCMDCGIPYCHQGCPVMNIIPEWNDLTYQGDMKSALAMLHSTNNFPEFTGRICPAPCEASCTLNLDDKPVTIKTIECAIVDNGWAEGWIEPKIAKHHTDKKIAVVGAGPAGMAAAQQLARVGHKVSLYEKNAHAGGLMRYGIPDFKLDKSIIDRRLSQLKGEGVDFRPNTTIGKDVSVESLMNYYDAIVLSGGAEKPRDLPVPGRELNGVHFAMDFLTQQNRRNGGESFDVTDILATGKNVLVIGGGDTGSDCVGTSARQGAASITQIEIMPRPPEKEDKLTTWPDWPQKLRTSTSHEEGCQRDWSLLTKAFIGDENGNLKAAKVVRVQWDHGKMTEVAGSEFEIPCERVFLAMGFVHPVHEGMLEQLGVAKDPRGNVDANTEDYQTSIPKVFAAGDMRRGQSLVVWAIREGRQAARAVDKFLMGSTELPR
ncbi:glutamate synthase subunit beta [Magnetovibrio blakemorei]|uniref:Glutamate synthase n=1 Tax=Magnetovibrio blakemorei TaxID=28181 RepID=A0A1E5QB96_9PROT|nr:glutamate synthase subunit beta [Magnetovibrio blakemorei]OEJ69289.1 glutamate synthase [Magnetovibrio blakemorei]